jgi:hypothetical protein
MQTRPPDSITPSRITSSSARSRSKRRPKRRPFVHATDDSIEQESRVAYRAFVDAFRAGAVRLRERAREIRDRFPL